MAGSSANFSLLSGLLERLTNVESQMKSVSNEVTDIKTQLRDFCSSTVVDGARVKRELDSDESKECVKRGRIDFEKEDGYVVVYTDGSCTNNGYKGAKAGIGVWFGPDHPLNTAQPVVGKATNNVAELQACICAVKIALDHGVDKLKIKTDSMLIVNSMTKWIHNWKKNHWMSTGGGPVKNQKELRELDTLTQKLQSIQWVHVKGHNGLAGNDSADALAQLGATF